MAYQMDFFAGVEEKVLAAIGTKVKYPAYVFIRDNEESVTGRLAFVDQNNVLKYIRGENKQHVVNVTELPAIGDQEVLYIYNGSLYIYNGTEYVALGNDYTAEFETLTEKVNELENSMEEIQGSNEDNVNKINELENEVDSVIESISSFADQIAEIEEGIKELDEKSKHVNEKVKYEIANVPIGTLVDYFEKEIRVMCPKDTVFTKQNVGDGGDADSYYMTFKTYVPSDDVVGYIEHLDDKVDSEILTDFSVDEYGRRYQPTWFALAKYNEAENAWTYYGASSTTEKYLGWNYRIDWYNSDGVVICSDSIRINLSNEECHFDIEPYYIGSMKASVEALRSSNATLVEQLEGMTETLTEIEERIVEVEKEIFTFVELE